MKRNKGKRIAKKRKSSHRKLALTLALVLALSSLWSNTAVFAQEESVVIPDGTKHGFADMCRAADIL